MEKNKKFVVTPLINPIDADLYTLEISTASPFLTINDTEILKNLSGMVKYCCNKQDGKFQYNRAAAALGITTDAVKLGIRILTEAKAFKILENNDEYSFIEYLSPIIAENLGGSIKYEEFVEHLISINEYKNQFR